MNDPTSRWRQLYESALMELDREQLLHSIDLAEEAIRERVKVMEGRNYDPDEPQAMEDALHALNLLRRSALRG
jgi:hypothetical protein